MAESRNKDKTLKTNEGNLHKRIQGFDNKRKDYLSKSRLAGTLWIKVWRFEIILREIHVTRDGPQLQTEQLAAVLELPVGTLTADLAGQLAR